MNTKMEQSTIYIAKPVERKGKLRKIILRRVDDQLEEVYRKLHSSKSPLPKSASMMYGQIAFCPFLKDRIVICGVMPEWCETCLETFREQNYDLVPWRVKKVRLRHKQKVVEDVISDDFKDRVLELKEQLIYKISFHRISCPFCGKTSSLSKEIMPYEGKEDVKLIRYWCRNCGWFKLTRKRERRRKKIGVKAIDR